jgi:pimeloyl-ACP methyl ester carboxylesterase
VRSGWHARRAAASVRPPVLIVQGAEDTLVHPEGTRRLAQRFPVPPRCVEVPGGHGLARPSSPSWEEVRRETLSFAAELQKECAERSMKPC